MKRTAINFFAVVSICFQSATAEGEIDNLRIQGAQDAFLAVGMGTIPAPEALIDYISVFAKYVIEADGAFLFDMPESTARAELTNQIGYQASLVSGQFD